MTEPLYLNLKKIYPNVKFDYMPRLSSGNKKLYSIRGIDKNREEAFKKLQQFLSDLKVQYEVKESRSISKNFPYVVSINFKNTQYQYTTKPDMAGRVSSGSGAQDKFAEFVKLFGATSVNTAKVGSQVADVSFNIGGVTENAEIKNSSSLTQINAFDITVYRQDKKSPASKDLSFVNDLIQAFKGYPTLEAYIDYLRQSDTSIGYSGDPGVKNKSGNLPSRYFKFTDSLDKATNTLKSHWNKDDYFVVVNGNKFTIFNTNKQGALANIIERLTGTTIPIFSTLNLKEISFKTYGGTRPGTIRMQLSISVASNSSIDYNENLTNKLKINI